MIWLLLPVLAVVIAVVAFQPMTWHGTDAKVGPITRLGFGLGFAGVVMLIFSKEFASRGLGTAGFAAFCIGFPLLFLGYIADVKGKP